MHGKAEPATRSGGRIATKEQLRMAQATQDEPDQDRSRIQKMIREIVETTRCSQSVAEIALHDANNNVEVAVNNILESSDHDTWTFKKKGQKSKEEEQETVKRGGNRGPRRGNQQNQRDYQQKGARTTENGNEGRENRQPREDGFRGGNRKGDQPRNRREPAGKREGRKPNADQKNEEDETWKNGPLVFSRRDNIDEKDQTQAPQQQVVEAANKTVAKPNNAGPLSFADVVRRNAQKAQPPPPVESDAQHSKLHVSNDAKQVSSSPHSLANADGLQPEDNAATFDSMFPESSKSPRQLSHHLDIESSAGALLHDDSVPFGAQPSSQKMHQSLTEQLKTDLGLGSTTTSVAFASPPKPLHQNKVSTVKAGVVEFLDAPPAATSGEWQFGFEATPTPQTIAEEHQFRRDNVSKLNEQARNDIGLPSANINESNASRNNASTVLNQYAQQQSSQYGVNSNSHQQPPFNNNNRNRNGVNNLPFSNNYSDNFNSSDLRSTSYGAPSSPPKSQPVQQPLQNLASQLPSQQAHHHQQPIFQPYPNYPYVNMYSPVAPGIRDDFGPMLPFQYNINQSSLDALMLMPQLNATSAASLPTNHQGQHHQNQQQSVQQGLQHNQSNEQLRNQQSHQRNEHFSDMKMFGQNMNIPPASQQNNGNGQNSQQNSNLGNNQQRQQLLDNNSQSSVGPPPGFNLGPTFLQRNAIFQQPFQAPPNFTHFPYVLPNHKSK